MKFELTAGGIAMPDGTTMRPIGRTGFTNGLVNVLLRQASSYDHDSKPDWIVVRCQMVDRMDNFLSCGHATLYDALASVATSMRKMADNDEAHAANLMANAKAVRERLAP